MDKITKKYLKSTGKKDTLDRLREHMFSGGLKKLNKTDQNLLKKLEFVNQLLTTNYSVSNAVKAIEREYEVTQAYAYKLIRDTKSLFGDIRESQKNGQKYILEEMYMRGALKALSANDLHAYGHFLDSIARMNGLFDNTTVQINMQQLVMPKVIMTSSDINTLREEMEALNNITIE